MKRRSLVPMVVALALAGCAQPPTVAAPDSPPKTVHVDRVRVELAAAFAPGYAELPVTEVTRLETFLDQAQLRPNDLAYVAASAGDPLAARRIARMTQLLARRGIGVQQVAPPPAGVAPNHLLVMVDRYVATGPTCPDWSQSPATPHDNTPSDNFGCATMTNFSLMIDNPRDLVHGRALGPADSDPAIAAYQRYQTGQLKPLLATSSETSQPAAGATQSSSSSGGGASTTGGSTAGSQ